MPYISVTLEVSKPEISRVRRLPQLPNIKDMVVTSDVSHVETFNSDSAVQPSKA